MLITVAAFHIYLSVVKMLLKGEVGGCALKSHGNYKLLIMENHGIVFLNFCGNPVKWRFIGGGIVVPFYMLTWFSSLKTFHNFLVSDTWKYLSS